MHLLQERWGSHLCLQMLKKGSIKRTSACCRAGGAHVSPTCLQLLKEEKELKRQILGKYEAEADDLDAKVSKAIVSGLLPTALSQ